VVLGKKKEAHLIKKSDLVMVIRETIIFHHRPFEDLRADTDSGRRGRREERRARMCESKTRKNKIRNNTEGNSEAVTKLIKGGAQKKVQDQGVAGELRIWRGAGEVFKRGYKKKSID